MKLLQISIITSKITINALLKKTPLALAVGEMLPLTGEVQRWGQEIYFSIPLHRKIEEGQTLMQVGDLAYWPAGNAFCIFFGPTPGSGGEIRAASDVEVFGKITSGDPTLLHGVASGETIQVQVKG